MTATDESIDEIRRDHPNDSELRGEALELLELWALYTEWKDHRHELNAIQGQLTRQSPESTEVIEKVLGSIPEFEAAGQSLRQSVESRLTELGQRDLAAAVARGELSDDERVQIDAIAMQCQREAELAAMKPSNERDNERER